VRSYRCSGCGVINRASNDLTGIKHTTTGGKPSGCEGTYHRIADGDEPDLAAEYERSRRAALADREGGEASS
jgi:hypothetical protein